MTAPATVRGSASDPGRVALRLFLWLNVLSSGIGLGAKLFDLLVVESAWGASPPDSLRHLPYGKEFPLDPGNFFQPLSAVLLIGLVGAVVCGWRTVERRWLLAGLGSFVVIWILTPTVFWPMIRELWELHRARLVLSAAETSALVHRWFVWDSFRSGLIALIWLTSLRALAGPVWRRA